MLARLLALFWLVGLLSAPGAGIAQERRLSPYEAETLRIALDRIGAEIDPTPEGKVVSAIEVVPFDVFEKRDWAPFFTFFNHFHTTTRPFIVAREVLLRPGDTYDPKRVLESERNLRRRQLSVVLVVPIKDPRPNRVKLLVVTKDIWSLRVNSDPRFVNGRLNYIALQPSEENLFGLNKTVNANFLMTRSYYSFGLGFIDPRVGGSRIRAAGSANLIFNCRTGHLQGSFGSFEYGKPLYSTRTKWSWKSSLEWNHSVARPAGTLGTSVCSAKSPALLDFAVTKERDNVPYRYWQDILEGELSAKRSFGVWFNNDIAFGLEARRRNFTLFEEAKVSPQIESEFHRIIPTSNTRISPFLELHAYKNDFLRVMNVETLGLQEDYRMGHDVQLRLYPAATAVGSSRNLLGVLSRLAYAFPIRDGFWRVFVGSTIELSDLKRSDAEIKTGTRFVSPRLKIGRLVYDGYLLHRYKNYLNPITSLGGTTRLRGYRQSAFVGSDVLISNLEYRSRPIELYSIQLGGVLFWDVGDAFFGFDRLKLNHGVGVGLRVLAPQIDRVVFRVDLGVPVNPNAPGADLNVVAQFNQAF